MEGKKMLVYIIIAICIILAVIGQIILKKGMNSIGQKSFSEYFQIGNLFHTLINPIILLGLACFVIAFFLWLFALARLDVSLMYPLIALGYVLLVLFSIVILHEKVTILRWIGTLLILAGSYFVIKS